MELRHGSYGVVINDFTFSWIEKGIEWFAGDGKHAFSVHYDNTISESLFKQGVVKRHVSKYFDGNSWTVIFMPKKKYFSDDVLDKVVTRWSLDIGKPYDYGNLFGKIFKKSHLYNSFNKRICSEHVAEGYRDIYLFCGKDPEKVTPHDLFLDAYSTGCKYFDAVPIKKGGIV